MFVDEASITVIAGAGGDGCLSFRREKYVPRGGPDGGDGGRGGSVVLLADAGVSTLLAFRYRTLFRAERGRHGQGSNKTGRSGADLVIRVPVGTVIKDAEGTRILADLAEDGRRFVAAAGGRGGRGNACFATSTNRAPTRHERGEPGAQVALRMELKLLADVGLIGFPNAGKSTLISRISAARPKVGDYPFTTLAPHLGVVDRGGFRSFVVADLPGLIEGARDGAGLGHRFLRHAERCRLLLHLVDPTDPAREPVEGIEALEQELIGYGDELAAKPRMLLLTKADLVQDPAPAERVRRFAAERGQDCPAVSAVTGQGLRELVHDLGRKLDSLPRRDGREEEPPGDGCPVVGVLGGTFDPVHLGHLAMAETALRLLDLERVLLMPSATPPHKSRPRLTPARHRAAMLRLAVEGRQGLEVCTMELDSGGVCYTVDSLRRLRRGPPPVCPVFVLGMDSLLDIGTWRDHEDLLWEFDLAVMDRPGAALVEVRDRLLPRVADSLVEIGRHGPDDPPGLFQHGAGGRVFHLPMAEVPVSSTEVRQRAARREDLDGLVPPAVDRYIRSNDLYR